MSAKSPRMGVWLTGLLGIIFAFVAIVDTSDGLGAGMCLLASTVSFGIILFSQKT